MRYILLVILFLVVGCRELLPFEDTVDCGEVTIGVSVGTESFSTVSSRSVGSVDNIDDLWVMVFDTLGGLVGSRYWSDYGGGLEHIVLPTSVFRLAVIANVGDIFGGVSDIEDFGEIYTTSPDDYLHYFSEQIAVSASQSVGGVVVLDTIYLLRPCAKVTVVLDTDNLYNDVSITPLQVSVRQTPLRCFVAGDNTPIGTSMISASGDSITQNLSPTDHSTATAFYILENLQGTNGTSSTLQSQKTPITGTEELCTYLEIQTLYTNSEGTRPVRYRYYLGENTTHDFNLRRNHWYQVDITFNGTGALTENSWRVTAGELEGIPTILPKDIYIPSIGYRTYSFGYSESLQMFEESSNPFYNQFEKTDKNAYIYFEDDYTGSVRDYIGQLKIDGNETRVYRLGSNHTQIIPDITTLFFPQNSTFGNTQYPITQHIQFLRNDESDFSNFSVASSQDWLYFGDGDTFRSFTEIGIPNTTTTETMNNNSTGKIPLTDLTSNYISVRCTDNTTSSPRSGYIFFYNNPTGEIYALVHIQQNPSSYPTSPFHLTYIHGGGYYPGAYKRNGNLDTSYSTDNTSTISFFALEDPMYVSTTEVTNLQFSDFLNDLNITSTSDLVGSNSILDKSNNNYNNYAGAVLKANKNSNNTFDQSLGLTVCNANGVWFPDIAYITAPFQTNSPYSAPIRLSNYPMQYLSFFTACDYNYWALKFSGNPPPRSTHSLLCAEMEWEAAARGIDNGYSSESEFSRGNGMYPFPLLTSTENTYFINNIASDFSYELLPYMWHGSVNVSGNLYSGNSVSKYAVGMLLPNIAGVHDMSGNVAEWSFDGYSGKNYHYSVGSLADNYCYGGNYGSTYYYTKTYRGGCAEQSTSDLTVASRYSIWPDDMSQQVGIRGFIELY